MLFNPVLLTCFDCKILFFVWTRYYTVGGSNDKRLTDVGTNKVVAILSALVSLLSLLHPGVILCACWTVSYLASFIGPFNKSNAWTESSFAGECSYCKAWEVAWWRQVNDVGLWTFSICGLVY